MKTFYSTNQCCLAVLQPSYCSAVLAHENLKGKTDYGNYEPMKLAHAYQ